MLNIFKTLFKKKNQESKSSFILATPPRNDESQNPKFQIGDSSKLKNELKNAKDELEEISNKNELLAENSKNMLLRKATQERNGIKKPKSSKIKLSSLCLIIRSLSNPPVPNKEQIK